MENKQIENLSEILALLENVQEEISLIKSKLSSLEALKITDTQDHSDEFTKEDIDIMDIVEIPDDMPDDDEPVVSVQPVVTADDSDKDIREEKEAKVTEDELILNGNDTHVPAAEITKAAVVDKMLDKEAWRTDRPSSPVKDVRSAIALNDRILFINTLFKGDPEAFQETISALNAMTDFEDAVSYIQERYPEWKMGSDSVYRFMMAVRRKLDK